MEKIILERGGGKTTKLIEMSAKTGAYIVCTNHAEASMIAGFASKNGHNIPFPITYSEFLDKQYYRGLPGVLIDNAEMLLDRISMVPILALTITP